MTIFENLLSRLGYVKLDPYRRELLARAEMAAGIAAAELPAGVFVPAAVAPTPVAPAPVAPPARVARASAPPPIPRADPRHEDATVIDHQPRVDANDDSDEEWEWRLAMARAHARDDHEPAEPAAPAEPPPYVPSLPRPVHRASRRAKGLPPHRKLPLTASDLREGWKR